MYIHFTYIKIETVYDRLEYAGSTFYGTDWKETQI